MSHLIFGSKPSNHKCHGILIYQCQMKHLETRCPQPSTTHSYTPHPLPTFTTYHSLPTPTLPTHNHLLPTFTTYHPLPIQYYPLPTTTPCHPLPTYSILTLLHHQSKFEKVLAHHFTTKLMNKLHSPQCKFL